MASICNQEIEESPQLIDIADMPDFNPVVKNGLRSVTQDLIFWTKNNKVTCKEHGACLCLSQDRNIWRCPTCNEGAYVIWNFNLAKYLKTLKVKVSSETISVLEMFAYQGPPSKRWIETKGEFYQGWNRAVSKIVPLVSISLSSVHTQEAFKT